MRFIGIRLIRNKFIFGKKKKKKNGKE